MSNLSRICSIYIAKIVCAILVIMIHTSPLQSFSEKLNFYLVQWVARIAVPFFFATSGFFISKKLRSFNNIEDQIKYIKKYEIRIICLYLIWSLIYLFLYQIPYWNSINWTGMLAVKDYIFSLIMKGSTYHFWYFVSLIYAVPVFSLVLLVKKKYVHLLVAAIMYFIKLLLYSYSWITPEYLLNLYNIFSGIADGFLIAVPFMVIGSCLADNTMLSIFIKKYRYRGLIISVIASFVEITILYNIEKCVSYSYIITTPFVCLFFFACVLECNLNNLKINIELINISTVMYCIHPLFIYSLQLFENMNSLFKFLYVLFLSIIMSLVIIKIGNKTRLKIIMLLY